MERDMQVLKSLQSGRKLIIVGFSRFKKMGMDPLQSGVNVFLNSSRRRKNPKNSLCKCKEW
jgi:hypothetical protein